MTIAILNFQSILWKFDFSNYFKLIFFKESFLCNYFETIILQKIFSKLIQKELNLLIKMDISSNS